MAPAVRTRMTPASSTASLGSAEAGGRARPDPAGLRARIRGFGRPATYARSLASTVHRHWLTLRRENIPRIGLLSIILLLVASGAIYVVERTEGQQSFTSFGEALWYGAVTMTTVGYGDLTPRSGPARAIAVVLMLGGMGLLSLFTATVASVMVARKIKVSRGLEVIDKMKGHVLVCGWNQHAERVLDGLLAQPDEQVVLVNEVPEEGMNELLTRYRGRDVSYVRGDPAVEGVLFRANVQQARSAVVLADASSGAGTASDELTTLVTLAIKSLNPNVKVTAEAVEMKSETHLRRAGADDIVITGEYNGFLLSSTAIVPGISQVVRGLLSSSGNCLRREPVPVGLAGRTFGELFQELRGRYGFLTLAIVSESKGITLDDLTDDDSLVDQFIKQQFSDAGMDYLRFEDGGIRVLVNPDDAYIVGEGDIAIGISRST